MQGSRPELPEMLVLDILSKLPVKSLTRFKCVSKSWSSSFQTPFFINQHYHNNLRNNNLNLLLTRCNTISDTCYFSQLSTQNFSQKQTIHLPFVAYLTDNLTVYGPRNGLLCLECEDILCLWNPSTREFRILPQSSIQHPTSLEYTVETSLDCLGFGYDSQTDDYKVVTFFINSFSFDYYEERQYSHSTDQVGLYSLQDNSWKEISNPGAEVCVWFSTVFDNYVNGFCYWLATGESSILILSFDMVHESFSTLPMPDFDVDLEQHYLQLLNYNGLLGAIFYPREETLKSFDLWVMSESWIKQFSIESVPGVERPLGFWKNGELFLESSENELVLFDPSTRELKNLGIQSYKEKMQMIAYVEILVLFNGRSEHEERIIRWTTESPALSS